MQTSMSNLDIMESSGKRKASKWEMMDGLPLPSTLPQWISISSAGPSSFFSGLGANSTASLGTRKICAHIFFSCLRNRARQLCFKSSSHPRRPSSLHWKGNETGENETVLWLALNRSEAHSSIQWERLRQGAISGVARLKCLRSFSLSSSSNSVTAKRIHLWVGCFYRIPIQFNPAL